MQRKGNGHAKHLPSASSALQFPRQILGFVWGNKLNLIDKWKDNHGQASGDSQVWLFFSLVHNKLGLCLHSGRETKEVYEMCEVFHLPFSNLQKLSCYG